LLGQEANDQLVLTFHVALPASLAALPKSASKLKAKRNTFNVIKVTVAVKIKKKQQIQKFDRNVELLFFCFILKNSPLANTLSSSLSNVVTCLQTACT
jgi:hypothetical protein